MKIILLLILLTVCASTIAVLAGGCNLAGSNGLLLVVLFVTIVALIISVLERYT